MIKKVKDWLKPEEIQEQFKIGEIVIVKFSSHFLLGELLKINNSTQTCEVNIIKVISTNKSTLVNKITALLHIGINSFELKLLRKFIPRIHNF